MVNFTDAEDQLNDSELVYVPHTSTALGAVVTLHVPTMDCMCLLLDGVSVLHEKTMCIAY